MLIGVFAAGLCGFAGGKIAFRVRGAYFVIVSISLAEVVRLVAVNWVDAHARADGAQQHPAVDARQPPRELAGWPRIIALRGNEPLAASVGIDVARYLVLATVISAAMAGIAGALYAHYVPIVDRHIFLFTYTVTMVIMVITGGKRHACGTGRGRRPIRNTPGAASLLRNGAGAAIGAARWDHGPGVVSTSAEDRA
jgi:branched-chain amino acid transport system permease protein